MARHLVDSLEALLNRAPLIAEQVAAMQATHPSPLSKEQIAAAKNDYARWYTEARDAAPDAMKSQLDQCYRDRRGEQRIESFWSDPVAWGKDPFAAVLPGLLPEEGWRYPQATTFRRPFEQQQHMLRLALVAARNRDATSQTAPHIGHDMRQTLAAIGKDYYTIAGIDDLFLSAGAREEWWVEPSRAPSSTRAERVFGWIEGVCLHAPSDSVALIRQVGRAVLANPSLAADQHENLRAAVERLGSAVESTPAADSTVPRGESPSREKIFIGHGRSKIYQELVLHLQGEWVAEVVFFESEDRTAQQITQVLETMLRGATVALIIMTGEDQQVGGAVRARQNVIHEAGLFHARLGFDRVALLKPSGVEKFTNMDGLIYVPLDEQNIEHSFTRIDRFLRNCGLTRKP